MGTFSQLSLRRAVAMLRAGEVSSGELVRGALRDAEHDHRGGAFVALDPERALRDAAGPHPGPLAGVPVAVKDMIDVAGLATRGGSRATDPAPARRDAAVVARLRRAGAVVVGKTAMHELAYGTITPTVVNPRAAGLIAGGSSGGSAAAVAAGIVPLALGTDTAGSVRIPAVCCGVSGLIVAPGTCEGAGIMALSPSFDTVGPIVADPDDLALAWEALAGERIEAGDRPPPQVRIAAAPVLGRVAEGALDAVAGVAARLAGTGRAATWLGSETLPGFAEWTAPRAIVIADESLRAHRRAGLYPGRASCLGDEIRESHEAARRRDPGEVRAARDALRALGRRLRDAVPAGCVLLTPGLPHAPPPVGVDARAAGRLTRLVAPVNAAGLAAVVIPVGDCGVQLIARDLGTLLTALARR